MQFSSRVAILATYNIDIVYTRILASSFYISFSAVDIVLSRAPHHWMCLQMAI